jgi:protein-disulfide isomerase
MPPSQSLLAVAATASLLLTGCQNANDEAFGQRVRAYLLAHPEVIQETIEKLQQNQQAESLKVAAASLKTYRSQLEQDERDYVANPQGSITVVEFFDYNCGYCKLAAPEVVKLIAENPDVRVVFKEFPIFGGDSNLAAEVILSDIAKPKSLELYRSFMATKPLDGRAIDRILREAGIDPAVARAQGKSKAVQKQLADVRALATGLRIDGTPAFVVGDRIIPGADMAALRLAIAETRAAKAKTS